MVTIEEFASKERKKAFEMAAKRGCKAPFKACRKNGLWVIRAVVNCHI